MMMGIAEWQIASGNCSWISLLCMVCKPVIACCDPDTIATYLDSNCHSPKHMADEEQRGAVRRAAERAVHSLCHKGQSTMQAF